MLFEFSQAFYTILALVFVAVLIPSLVANFSLAYWSPTRRKDLPRVNRLAALKPGQIFIDLGCGDGRVCHYIAAHNPDSRVIGVEISWALYLLAQARRLFFLHRNLTIRFGNAFKQDLSGADVIYFYGLPESIKQKLKPKILAEAPTGSRIISYSFEVKDWPGRHIERSSAPHSPTIFVYER